MLRKRYRPLDAVEERSVGVEQLLQVGLLQDEQSYCFSWPDAPLTSMLRRSNASLALGMQSGLAPSTNSVVVQPPVYAIDKIAAEHGRVDIFNSFSNSNPAISFLKTNPSLSVHNNTIQGHKRHPSASVVTSTDDNIFSFNAEQIVELKAAGAFTAFAEALRRAAPSTVSNNDEELELMARREMEEELVRLEWRAHQKSEKTDPATQRMVLLGAAVPFLDNSKKNGSEDTAQCSRTWQRIMYDLWLKWRQGTFQSNGELVSGPNALPWGSPLLPGSFLASSAKEYFLNPNGERNGAVKAGRSYEKTGGDIDDQQVISSAFPRRRGAYGFLRWRIDVYEPRLRAASGGSRGEHGLVGCANLLSATEVNKLIEEKLPPLLTDLVLDERMDPIDAIGVTDIRSGVETWRQWLAHM
ncbi:uncharacterized protein TM35_000191840 [Trypanosoma theileri]|uniref:Uncharacterized protein n=1 Tax=Trypanosoma theileri TaxID=67003 RepID=A0A1X0NV02_9TRYP|nr:uncharacterized protein TM35_000191840 [Trypanosoma theileri]ORC87940.1 hypothetical protein TM35_000191840 [Trypanosoma theileri]